MPILPIFIGRVTAFGSALLVGAGARNCVFALGIYSHCARINICEIGSLS